MSRPAPASGAGRRRGPAEAAAASGGFAERLPEEIQAASERLAPYLSETPFEPAPGLAPGPGWEVFAKWECFQATGSFKARGALNKLLRLRETGGAAALREGVVTASSGNHARAVAWALSRLGGRGVVFLPETVAESKRAALAERYSGVVELRLVGEDAIEAERAARAEAERGGRPFVSPYNDPDIVAGQGTAGLEMDRALGDEPLDAALIPVGGGGLAAGVAGWLRRRAERAMSDRIARTFTIDRARLGSMAGALSGGNQQKVAVGKWTGSRPKVLLVHEPTRGVDVGARAEIYSHLRSIARQGMGIVFASSDTQEVLGIADTVAAFFRGARVSVRNRRDTDSGLLTREITHPHEGES